jgi:hypothetical protein
MPEKTDILMRQNESKNSSLLGCDSIIWHFDVLKNHSARVLDPTGEGTQSFSAGNNSQSDIASLPRGLNCSSKPLSARLWSTALKGGC